jgi:hypothetical protein
VKPTLLVAVLAAGAAAVAVQSRGLRPAEVTSEAPPSSARGALRAAPCPDGTLPDDGVCIPAPSPPGARRAPGSGRDRIPRRQDRPEDFAAYRLPVRATMAAPSTTEAPDGGQPPGGALLDAPPASTVTAPELEGQEGPTRVVYSGQLVGATVVTVHTVAVGGRKSAVLVIIGNLASAPPLSPGQELGPAAPLGALGSAPLYLETRLLGAGVDPLAVARDQLRSDATSVLVDPRNVLAKR